MARPIGLFAYSRAAPSCSWASLPGSPPIAASRRPASLHAASPVAMQRRQHAGPTLCRRSAQRRGRARPAGRNNRAHRDSRTGALTEDGSAPGVQAPARDVLPAPGGVPGGAHRQEHHADLVLVSRHVLPAVLSLLHAAEAVGAGVHAVQLLDVLPRQPGRVARVPGCRREKPSLAWAAAQTPRRGRGQGRRHTPGDVLHVAIAPAIGNEAPEALLGPLVDPARLCVGGDQVSARTLRGTGMRRHRPHRHTHVRGAPQAAYAPPRPHLCRRRHRPRRVLPCPVPSLEWSPSSWGGR